jgi:hypothetical protein
MTSTSGEHVKTWSSTTVLNVSINVPRARQGMEQHHRAQHELHKLHKLHKLHRRLPRVQRVPRSSSTSSWSTPPPSLLSLWTPPSCSTTSLAPSTTPSIRRPLLTSSPLEPGTAARITSSSTSGQAATGQRPGSDRATTGQRPSSDRAATGQQPGSDRKATGQLFSSKAAAHRSGGGGVAASTTRPSSP